MLLALLFGSTRTILIIIKEKLGRFFYGFSHYVLGLPDDRVSVEISGWVKP